MTIFEKLKEAKTKEEMVEILDIHALDVALSEGKIIEAEWLDKDFDKVAEDVVKRVALMLIEKALRRDNDE